jgi:hypothetical protein
LVPAFVVAGTDMACSSPRSRTSSSRPSDWRRRARHRAPTTRSASSAASLVDGLLPAVQVGAMPGRLRSGRATNNGRDRSVIA